MKRRSFRDEGKHFAALHKATQKAANVLLQSYGKLSKSQVTEKAKNDFVTAVDKKTQKILMRELERAYPDYGFIAEEDGVYNDLERSWVIDPLDGTANFIYQIPAFCISIALKEGNDLVLGYVYDPIHDECFRASFGNGSRLNRKPIHVSKTKQLSKAVLATGFPFRCKSRFKAYHESFKRMFYKSQGIRRLGSAALDLCYTACGRFDGFWELGLKIWDSAAGAVIIREAGGVVSDFKNTANFVNTGNTLAGNPWIHKQMLHMLSKMRDLEPE